MDIIAHHKNARMTPRKLTPLRAVVRGLPVLQAQAQLQFMSGKGPNIVGAVLKSAVANAMHNHSLVASDLVVRDVIISAGLTMKRSNPVSRGMAHPILKRLANVTVVVGPVDDASTPEKSAPKKPASADIETITAAEHMQREVADVHEEVVTEEKAGKGLSVPAPSKKELASNKIRTAQQGGDKNKGHRRKSMSEK